MTDGSEAAKTGDVGKWGVHLATSSTQARPAMGLTGGA
jgi:hypothetical protein